MIGRAKSQLSLLDSVFNKRKKRCRQDELLGRINQYVDWRPLVQACQRLFKKSKRGRPSIPIEYSLKCLFLQFLYSLSDPGLEDALIDRLSFQRFLGVNAEEELPDFTTIWRFRERLVKAKLHDQIFEMLLHQLEKENLILRRGTLIDATIVQASRRPRKQDSASNEENEQTETEANHRTSCQRDLHASHTRKGKKRYYGYKGHISMDQGSAIIRKKVFTTASVHDSQIRDDLICGDERSIFADKAYPDDNHKRLMRKNGVFYGILDKGRRNRPLSKSQKKKNKQKSKVRNAVERPFAHFKHLYQFTRVRYVNLDRNDLHFTFLCMIYNIRRGIVLSMV